MAKFSRSLPEQLVYALARLAGEANANWWKEILGNPDLHIAIRDDYLNVYAKGQSVFKIEMSKTGRRADRSLVMTTHYKYLMKPNMPPGNEYVTFDGKRFLTGGAPLNPAKLIQMNYVPKRTIPELIRTAASYSSAEKSAVDIIAKKNPNVIDMEIAFSGTDNPEDPALPHADDDRKPKATAPLRIDLAALHPFEVNKARLVFYEVKRFDDQRLWGSHPEVLKQIKTYDAFLKDHKRSLIAAYKSVCRGLNELRGAANMNVLSSLVREVAQGKDLVVDEKCRLVIIGFDQDQQKGRLKQLGALPELDGRLSMRGSPNGLTLPP